MSTYIVDRQPGKYGGQQKSYVEASNAIVDETTKSFRKAVDGKEDLIALFHKTLDSLGEARHDLAVKSGTKEAHHFGKYRTQAAHFPSPSPLTPLSGPYEEYNAPVLALLQKHLKTMTHTPKEFQQTELKKEGEPCLGRSSSLEISILTFENSKKWLISFTEEEYERLCKLCGAVPQKPFKVEHFNLLTTNLACMEKLKQASIEDYKKLKITLAIPTIRLLFEGRKSDWVLATVRFEIDGKLYALSQYFTWLYRDFQNDPVEEMSKKSVVSILHQDTFLVSKTLEDAAKIFKKILESDGKDIKALQDQMALFQFLLAQAMPYVRGSAAVAEWIERALFNVHGLTPSYKPQKMVNLAILTSMPSDFVKNYGSMFTLEKIKPAQEEKE